MWSSAFAGAIRTKCSAAIKMITTPSMGFEVPYNFDLREIEILENFRQRYLIHTFFMSTFKEDGFCCKRFYSTPGCPGIGNEPTTRKDYELHVAAALHAGFPIATMFQHPLEDISEDQLKYYLSLGFNRFIVNRESVAQKLKELSPSVYIIGSITKKVSIQEAIDINSELFDNLVLPFQFNRSFAMLDMLPKTKEYTLLVNCGCSIACPGTNHWFAGDPRLSDIEIIKEPSGDYRESRHRSNCPKTAENSIEIPPALLPTLLRHGIHNFKLQGREYSTPQLIQDIRTYLDLDSATSKGGSSPCLDSICLEGVEAYFNRIAISQDLSTSIRSECF